MHMLEAVHDVQACEVLRALLSNLTHHFLADQASLEHLLRHSYRRSWAANVERPASLDAIA